MNCEGAEYEIFESKNNKWISITNNILVQFHVHKTFSNIEYVNKRNKIYDMLEKEGFKIEVGIKDIQHEKNSTQFWSRI